MLQDRMNACLGNYAIEASLANRTLLIEFAMRFSLYLSQLNAAKSIFIEPYDPINAFAYEAEWYDDKPSTDATKTPTFQYATFVEMLWDKGTGFVTLERNIGQLFEVISDDLNYLHSVKTSMEHILAINGTDAQKQAFARASNEESGRWRWKPLQFVCEGKKTAAEIENTMGHLEQWLTGGGFRDGYANLPHMNMDVSSIESYNLDSALFDEYSALAKVYNLKAIAGIPFSLEIIFAFLNTIEPDSESIWKDLLVSVDLARAYTEKVATITEIFEAKRKDLMKSLHHIVFASTVKQQIVYGKVVMDYWDEMANLLGMVGTHEAVGNRDYRGPINSKKQKLEDQYRKKLGKWIL